MQQPVWVLLDFRAVEDEAGAVFLTLAYLQLEHLGPTLSFFSPSPKMQSLVETETLLVNQFLTRPTAARKEFHTTCFSANTRLLN